MRRPLGYIVPLLMLAVEPVAVPALGRVALS